MVLLGGESYRRRKSSGRCGTLRENGLPASDHKRETEQNESKSERKAHMSSIVLCSIPTAICGMNEQNFNQLSIDKTRSSQNLLYKHPYINDFK
jgi:hypothetical protein